MVQPKEIQKLKTENMIAGLLYNMRGLIAKNDPNSKPTDNEIILTALLIAFRQSSFTTEDQQAIVDIDKKYGPMEKS